MFHIADHIADDFGRFGSFLLMDVAPFEHFNVPIKQSYGMRSERYLARMVKTAHNMSRALEIVWRVETENHGGAGDVCEVGVCK